MWKIIQSYRFFLTFVVSTVLLRELMALPQVSRGSYHLTNNTAKNWIDQRAQGSFGWQNPRPNPTWNVSQINNWGSVQHPNAYNITNSIRNTPSSGSSQIPRNPNLKNNSSGNLPYNQNNYTAIPWNIKSQHPGMIVNIPNNRFTTPSPYAGQQLQNPGFLPPRNNLSTHWRPNPPQTNHFYPGFRPQPQSSQFNTTNNRFSELLNSSLSHPISPSKQATPRPINGLFSGNSTATWNTPQPATQQQPSLFFGGQIQPSSTFTGTKDWKTPQSPPHQLLPQQSFTGGNIPLASIGGNTWNIAENSPTNPIGSGIPLAPINSGKSVNPAALSYSDGYNPAVPGPLAHNVDYPGPQAHYAPFGQQGQTDGNKLYPNLFANFVAK